MSAPSKPNWNDPAHWRGRGEEIRALARQIDDPEAKRRMLRLAEDYDKLAQRAKVRAAKQ